MGKGILKRHESTESGTPDSTSKHVKWDEQKLKDSEAIKLTIPKGQIDEPKTPFQHGQYEVLTGDEDEIFTLKQGEDCNGEEGGDSSDESFQRNQSEDSNVSSGGWESSMSELEDNENERDREHGEKFKSMRAQHYFMKQALERGKELIETDDDEDEDYEEEDKNSI